MLELFVCRVICYVCGFERLKTMSSQQSPRTLLSWRKSTGKRNCSAGSSIHIGSPRSLSTTPPPYLNSIGPRWLKEISFGTRSAYLVTFQKFCAVVMPAGGHQCPGWKPTALGRTQSEFGAFLELLLGPRAASGTLAREWPQSLLLPPVQQF